MTAVPTSLAAALLSLAISSPVAAPAERRVVVDPSAITVHLTESDLNALLAPYATASTDLAFSGHRDTLKNKFHQVDYQIGMEKTSLSLQPENRVILSTRISSLSLHAGSVYKLRKDGRASRLQCHDVGIDLDPRKPVSMEVSFKLGMNEGALNILSAEVHLPEGSEGFRVPKPGRCKGAWIFNPLLKHLLRSRLRKKLQDLDLLLGSILEKELASLGSLPAVEHAFRIHPSLGAGMTQFFLRPSGLDTSHHALQLRLALQRGAWEEDPVPQETPPSHWLHPPEQALDEPATPAAQSPQRSTPGTTPSFESGPDPETTSAGRPVVPSSGHSPDNPDRRDDKPAPPSRPVQRSHSSYMAVSRRALNHLFDSMVTGSHQPPLKMAATGKVSAALRSDLFKDLFPRLDQVPVKTKLALSLGLSTAPVISLQSDPGSDGVVIDVTTWTDEGSPAVGNAMVPSLQGSSAVDPLSHSSGGGHEAQAAGDGVCHQAGFQLQLWDDSTTEPRSLGSVFIGPQLRFSASLTAQGQLALELRQSQWEVCSDTNGRQSKVLAALLQAAITPLSLRSRLRPLDFPILRLGQRHLKAVHLEARENELRIQLGVVRHHP